MLASVLLSILQLVVLIAGITPQPEPIFLHYTTYFGVDLIGPWYLTYLIPSGSILFLILNGALAYVLAPIDKILGYILTWCTMFVATFLLIYTILIVRLNL